MKYLVNKWHIALMCFIVLLAIGNGLYYFSKSELKIEASTTFYWTEGIPGEDKFIEGLTSYHYDTVETCEAGFNEVFDIITNLYSTVEVRYRCRTHVK